MIGETVAAVFFATQSDAKVNGPAARFNGATQFRLIVTHQISLTQFHCAVAWAKDYAGPPEDSTKVPDLPIAYLEGGTICAIRTKVWSQSSRRVILGLEVLDRA